jgi:hypothetical protein
MGSVEKMIADPYYLSSPLVSSKNQFYKNNKDISNEKYSILRHHIYHLRRNCILAYRPIRIFGTFTKILIPFGFNRIFCRKTHWP